MAVFENITEREVLGEARCESMPVLQDILDSLPVGISYFNRNEQFQFANKRYKFLLGVKVNTLTGKTLKQAIGEKSYEVAGKFAKRALKGEAVSFENVLRRGTSSEVSVLVSYIPDAGPDNVVRGFYALVEDITKRKRSERALRDLSCRLIAAQEDEQKRIARELHDDLSQELALIAVELDLLELDLPKNRKDISRRLTHIYKMAREASSAVHNISHHLHPAMLDQLGLAAAITEYCNEISAHQGPLIEFKNLGVSGTLPADVSLSFYRVLQESIQNALKHSGSDRISVTFFSKGKKTCLTVQDEGRGFSFDPDADYGLGLRSMAERMAIIGGTFDISTEPGKGTLITACRAP